MKTKLYVHLLLGFALSLKVFAKPVPQPDVIDVANDLSIIAVEGVSHSSKSDATDFSDSGSVTSPEDHSSINAAQTSSYAVGTFRGSGSVNVTSGTYLGSNSVNVAGETSVYILFEVPVASHFHYSSTISKNGNLGGSIDFNGLSNPEGQVTASGTLYPGLLYDLYAQMGVGTNNNSGHGTWTYDLSITPTNVMPGRFTARQKADFYAQITELGFLATGLTTAAQKQSSGELQEELLEAARGILDLVDKLDQDYADPLDTNYAALPTVTFPTVTPLAANARITAASAHKYNLWLTNLSQLEGYNTALTTAINRAQGAQFEGDANWETKQMNAAVQFEAQAATLLDQEPGLRSNVVSQFAADGFSAIKITANEALNFQAEVATNGLPTNLVADLTTLGADSVTISNLQNTILTSDPNNMTNGFPGSFANPSLDAAQLGGANGLRDASLALINAAGLPGGKFRFDVPTEPGIVYTIQFNANATDPSGWTTVFSNNAAGALLSFTNSPPNGATGFYRASHY